MAIPMSVSRSGSPMTCARAGSAANRAEAVYGVSLDAAGHVDRPATAKLRGAAGKREPEKARVLSGSPA
jgi:hypothetical protein